MIKIVLLAFLTAIVTLLITPLFIKISKRLKITDKPNHRKIHAEPIPTLGGLVIFISFLVGLAILNPTSEYHISIIVGAFVIIALGIVDDLYNLSPKIKFIGQFSIAIMVVFWGGLQVEFINLPFGGQVEFGFLSSIITIVWIVGITNAINLIDGLDGLAAGVSSIALATIAIMAMMMTEVYVATMALILLFSTLGFLRYNFFPAKIFMGDTGSMFLGYMIAVISLLGFKNVTFISFVIPIFILGVPISDTLIAMVRRKLNGQSISSPDSSHMHHRLIKVGFSHKQTVLFLYGLSGMFSLAAISFSMTTVWGSFIIVATMLITLQVLIENLGLIKTNYKPLTNLLKAFRHK